MSEKRDYLQAAADLKRIVGALKRVVPHVRKLGTIKSAAERPVARSIASAGLIDLGLRLLRLAIEIIGEDEKDQKTAKARSELHEAVSRAEHVFGGGQ